MGRNLSMTISNSDLCSSQIFWSFRPPLFKILRTLLHSSSIGYLSHQMTRSHRLNLLDHSLSSGFFLENLFYFCIKISNFHQFGWALKLKLQQCNNYWIKAKTLYSPYFLHHAVGPLLKFNWKIRPLCIVISLLVQIIASSNHTTTAVIISVNDIDTDDLNYDDIYVIDISSHGVELIVTFQVKNAASQ